MAGAKKQTRAERRDALDVLTDDDLRGGLIRRKALLTERLADHMTDRLMPDWFSNSPQYKAQHKNQEELLLAAIDDIEERLAGASKVLRAFSGRALNGSEDIPAAAEAS